MQIKVAVSSSAHKSNILHTTLFVQKEYSRTNYIESNFAEEIHMKNPFRC